MLESLWSWLGEKTGVGESVQPAGQPSFEVLEPRVLLNADLIGTPLLPCLRVASDNEAIVEGLSREGVGSQESGSHVIAAVSVSSGQACLAEQSDTGSQSGAWDLGPVDQDDVTESEAGSTADLNLQTPGGFIIVTGGTSGQVLCDAPDGCPGGCDCADEPVTVQAPAEASPRGPPAAGETTVNQIIFIDPAVDPGFQLKEKTRVYPALPLSFWILGGTVSARLRTSSRRIGTSRPFTSSPTVPRVR